MSEANKNICDSCVRATCIFQYGIIRKKCDFYMPCDCNKAECSKSRVDDIPAIIPANKE